MKRMALVILVLFILVATSPAQSGSFITATVPFPFHVGNNHVPAGDYRVAYYGTNGILVVANAKEQEVLAVQGYLAKHTDPSATPKLVFHKYGENYFLVGVRMPQRKMHALPQSSSEREFLTKAAPEEVTLVARN
jgi:hypothetical protein